MNEFSLNPVAALRPNQEDICTVPYLDDLASYGHVALGALAVYLGGRWLAAISLGFLLYQLSETSETLATKIGDLSEYATGLLGAAVLGVRR